MDITEIAKIAVPSLTALIVPFITYRWLTRRMAYYQTILSKEIEDYKKDISKELETYKFQLQSDFQTKFYEFQTRFSVLHQEQANVIKDLFALLFRLKSRITGLEGLKKLFNDKAVGYINSSLIDKKEELKKQSVEELIDSYVNLTNFYYEKSIYLSPKICQSIDELLSKSGEIIIFHTMPFIISEKFRNVIGEKDLNEILLKDFKIDANNITNAIRILESEFRQLLSAENPNKQLEKKQ